MLVIIRKPPVPDYTLRWHNLSNPAMPCILHTPGRLIRRASGPHAGGQRDKEPTTQSGHL